MEFEVDYFAQSVAFGSKGGLACGGGTPGDEELKSPGCVTFWKSVDNDGPETLLGLPGRVQYVRFSPDERSLAVAAVGGCVILDLTDGNRRPLSTHANWFDGLAWSPDGRYVAGGTMGLESAAPKLVVWDAETGKVKFDSRGVDDHTEAVRCVAFSPNGKLLASGGNDGRIQLRDVATGKRVGLIESHSGFIWSLVFSQDSRSLFSGSGDDTINIWDVDRKELRLSFPAHSDGTKALALSQDETLLLSGGLYDATLRAWRAPRLTDLPSASLRSRYHRLGGSGTTIIQHIFGSQFRFTTRPALSHQRRDGRFLPFIQ